MTAPDSSLSSSASSSRRAGHTGESRKPGDWFSARLKSLRPIHIALLAVAALVFIAISLLLARFLSTENIERDDVLAVLEAQAAGDARRMLRSLSGCSSHPACVATMRSNASRLRRSGSVKILSLSSSTAYSLSGASGKTRVAWTVIGRLPVVQCVQVTRSGDFVRGMSVKLSAISAPIPSEADC